MRSPLAPLAPGILDLRHHLHFVVRDSHRQRVGLGTEGFFGVRQQCAVQRCIARLPAVEAGSDFLRSPRSGPSQGRARLHRGVKGLVQVPDLC